ncbi:hypothetical protein GALMADRAFT_595027 [Galerina marginata CBS 339.88]|uniref:Uncharacterized protein n=1 Tax=Galerina marginata (strain CBS 339.88) TaxID=685588 RepID=A0A067T4N8_GALM3|nr:hypothetical protein GALMADRAFT_595027 [Galerina marginata CBS 339.88]
MSETSRTRLFFFLLTFAVTITCSIAICVLSAILLSWLNNLSLPGYRGAVDHAFGKLTATLGVGLTAAMALLISFILMLAPLTMPNRVETRITKPVGTIVALLWVGAIIVSIVFCGMTRWHPCAVMSRLQHSLSLRSAAPIPGAVSACREIMVLDIFAVINWWLSWLAARARRNPRPA